MATLLSKRSNVTANIPTIVQLSLGEIGINTFDGKIFIKRDVDNTIVEIGTTLPIYKNTTEEFTATSGQTIFGTTGFTGTADVSVFHNGLLLATTEYTLLTPNVTLNTGAIVSDLISIKILDLGV